MKNLFKTTVAAICLGILAGGMVACEEDPTPPVVDPGSNNGTVVLSGSITSNTTLDASKSYLLKGFVYVVAPATLTIPAGTVIKGDQDSKATLIVERGAKIIADGTESNPIVFTSNQPVGQRNYGDWGGVIVLGKAPQNQATTPIIEGGVDRPYGGTDANDNSGILRYVRIEYAGIALTTDNEINGLTLGAVGAGTIIDNVQVSYCGDDAFEFFGGTVNAKHLIAFRTWDDEFDTDLGYSGKIQFAVSLRDPAIADVSTSNGFESDNDGVGSATTIKTSAVFSNVSVFGHYRQIADTATANSLVGRGAHIRRNTSISIFNTVITGYKEGIRLDGTSTQQNMTDGNLVLKNVTLAGNVRSLNTAGSANSSDFTAAFNAAGSNNTSVALADLQLNANNFNLNAPNFLPQSNSPLIGSADFSHPKLGGGFFTTTNYRGAFGTIDWTANWANFNPANTVY
ncbi:MAG TPA: hypothetical protein VFV37_02390 [Luteibaculaceae bacterium]|nr:hypothetical protein [Luteibaculaceae bacterium]